MKIQSFKGADSLSRYASLKDARLPHLHHSLLNLHPTRSPGRRERVSIEEAVNTSL